MIWSKKLRQFRELLAPSLSGRLAIHNAAYRAAYEERGRIAVLWDGVEVLSFCDFVHENAWISAGVGNPPPEGVYSRGDFSRALGRIAALDIASAQGSDDPLIRGLAMLDRRTGRRKLIALRGVDEVPVVKAFLELRLRAEGLHDRTPAAG